MVMANNLVKARFFFESDVHSWLFNQYDDTKGVRIIKNCDFGFDIIDQPFYCAVKSGETHIEIKLYVRSEMGAFLEMPDVGVEIHTDGGGTKVTANSGRLGGDAAQTILLFFKAATILGTYIAQKNLLDEFSNMDTDTEGVMIRLVDDDLSFERVSGKKRPAMACTTLFGGIQLMRPYQDEIMDSWMDEMMPLEEKIELAEDGDEDMMEQLAHAYLNGDDEVEVEPEKAVYWLTKLAELDNSDAQFNLGLFNAKGFGIERSFKNALYWLERAEENGDTDAPNLIEKLKKAVIAEEIVSTGNAQAQADLAETYMFLGNSLDQAGADEDYKLAFEFAQKSAAQDNGDGIWTLALAYEHGRGVEANVEKAIEFYEKGAKLGHAPSQHSLACYYLRGDILEQDKNKGFELCLKSAEQGYGLAMRDVGRCYQFGNGVMGNMKTAVEWYEKALEVIDDLELEEKTALFKMLGENDEHWDDDFDENDDDMPDGFMLALEAFEEAEAYEIELANQGVMPNESLPGNGIMNLSPEGFPRIALKAEEGDERAIVIIEKIKAANEMEP